MKTVPDSRHARHLFTIQVPEKMRDTLLLALQEKGIGVAVNFRAVHLLQYYRETFGYHEGQYPFAEQIGAGTISLPLYPSLTDAEIDYVVQTVIDVLSS